MAWYDDKTVGGASITGTEWNTMTTVILASSSDLNNKLNTLLSTPSTHGSYSGILGTFTSGESTVLGNTLYYKSDGYLWKTDADSSTTSKGLIMMSVGTTTSSASATYLYSGLIANSAWSFTKGDILYLSVNSGEISNSIVTGTGDIVRIIGYALSSSIISFSPDNNYVELV